MHVFHHAGALVFGPGVVDAAADADIEAPHERRAVGDAEDAHRRGEVLRVTLFAGLVAHAVEGSGEVDERSRVAQPLFVLVVDVVAREAQQDEFLGREVAVDRDVRRCGDRVGAVEPVEARQQESDAESHVRRVVGAGSDAPVDLLFEGPIDVRAAVIVDDAADEPGAFHRGGEGRGVGRPGVFGVRMRLGLTDLRERRFGRGKILFRGLRALSGCRACGRQQESGGKKECNGLFHSVWGGVECKDNPYFPVVQNEQSEPLREATDPGKIPTFVAIQTIFVYGNRPPAAAA